MLLEEDIMKQNLSEESKIKLITKGKITQSTYVEGKCILLGKLQITSKPCPEINIASIFDMYLLLIFSLCMFCVCRYCIFHKNYIKPYTQFVSCLSLMATYFLHFDIFLCILVS